MKRVVLGVSLILSLSLSACSSHDVASPKPKAKAEEKAMIVKFKDVEEADEYLFDKIRDDQPYYFIEDILAKNNYVSEKDYDRLKQWYKSSSEGFIKAGKEQDEDFTALDWESMLETQKDGGTVIRKEKMFFLAMDTVGYKAEFESVDGTFKLAKLEPLSGK